MSFSRVEFVSIVLFVSKYYVCACACARVFDFLYFPFGATSVANRNGGLAKRLLGYLTYLAEEPLVEFLAHARGTWHLQVRKGRDTRPALLCISTASCTLDNPPFSPRPDHRGWRNGASITLLSNQDPNKSHVITITA